MGEDSRGDFAGPGVQVLLAGTATHRAGTGLPSVAAVRTSLTEAAGALTECCGVAPESLRVLTDPADPAQLGSALTEAAEQATSVLLFYYIGHGLVSAAGELHLATMATEDASRGLGYTALPFTAVREVLSGCRARAIVIVLDCCFAGRAGGPLGPGRDDGLAAAQLRGTYLLAAAAHDEQALAPPGDRCTAFTGALAGLLRDGDPRGPRWLTLGHVYRALAQRLPARGLPRPRRYAGGLADDLILAPNPAYQDAAPAARPVAGETPGEAAEPRSPYLGLAAFGPDDQRFFFGRDRLTAELSGRLAGAAAGDGAAITIVGPSGSGKSSLLRAGLIPAVERGALGLPGSAEWPVVLITPGEAPLDRLAAALSGPAGLPAAEIAGRLRAGPGGLAGVLAAILASRSGPPGDASPAGGSSPADGSGPAGDAGPDNTPGPADGSAPAGGDSRVVLLVDQFEEVFARCPDEAERHAFIAACAAPGPPGVAVLAVRADFYGRCLAYPALVPALRDRQVLAGPLTDAELHEVITQPARQAGLALQPGLAEVLLRDIHGGAPGPDEATLPLLSYALLATWQRREGRELTMAGYQAGGGIHGAVAQAAEHLYEQLDPAGQQAVQVILLAMIRIGEGTADTLCGADLDELAARRFAAGPAAFAAARDGLAGARLITLRASQADITHEALLRAWPRLRGWIEDDRASLLEHQRLADATARWDREQRDPATLYRGSLLDGARRWAAAHQPEVSARERAFLSASAELERTERRGTRRRRQAFVAVAVLAVAALVLGLVLVNMRRGAAASRLRGESQRYAAQALALADTNPQRAALLAVAGWQAAHSTAARSALLTVQMDAYAGQLIGSGATTAAAISPDGRYIATAAGVTGLSQRHPSRTVQLWDARTRHLIATLSLPGVAESVAFSPDGRVLAAAVLAKQAVWLWDVATRRVIRTVTGPGATAVAFSPDGHLLAVGEGGAQVDLWNPTSGAQVGVLPGSFAVVRSLAFSPDGRLLAAGGVAGTTTRPVRSGLTRVWRMPTGAPDVTRPDHRATVVNSVAFSPDGRLLASAGDNSQIELWDPVTRQAEPPLAGRGDITSVVFSPDGTDIVADGSDDTIRYWRAVSPHRYYAFDTTYPGAIVTLVFSRDAHTLLVAGLNGVLLLHQHDYSLSSAGALTSVAFSPDGRMIATAAQRGTIRLYDATTHWPARVITTQPGGSLAMAFSPDGRLLASGGQHGSLRLWDPATGARRAALRVIGPSVTGVGFSPDGSLLAAASWGANPATAAQVDAPGGIQVWDTRADTPLAHTTTHEALAGPAFAPDGSLLGYAVHPGDGGGEVVLANPRTLHPVGRPLPSTQPVWDLAFSPDGRLIAAGRGDGSIALWDTRSHRLVRTIQASTQVINSVAFSPGGQLLAAGGGDNLVRIFSVRTGALIATLTDHTNVVSDVAFSPDGRTLASAGADGYVFLWNIDPRAAVARLCQALRGPALASQWAALHAGVGPPPC